VKKSVVIAFSVTVLLILGVSAGLFFKNNQAPENAIPGQIAAAELNPAEWGKYYPKQYQSYLLNQNNTEKPSHLEAKPYMKTIYAGTGFAAEYNEPRGHVFTLEDIRAIDDQRKKTGAACNTCKSAQIPSLINTYGDQYYLMSFDEINSRLEYPIACADCHDPQTMQLRITRPALIEAFARQGKDITKATQQEMRSLVCAQCHVTYYFEKDTKHIVFPWDKGVKADQILDYYDEENFVEWNHPDAGSALVKARHAEYETFMGSTHQTAGLACADCHMPYTKVGNAKISSHKWMSPLNNIEESCTTCHRQDTTWLKSRVQDTQDKTKEMQTLAGNTIVTAIGELKKARETEGANAELLSQAQEAHRKGQWYLDYVMVTNGYGFHNPTDTLSNLGKAIRYGNEAIQLARDAVSGQG
jgi:nitrite reductase (cytochrome c-552)